MSTIEIWWIGIALAMDCFAVSFSLGISARRVVLGVMAAMIVVFGLFQGLFFLAGYAGVSLVSPYITALGNWVAVALLTFLGAKMIWEDVRPSKSKESASSPSLRTVPLLAVATSIDALAVGVSFSCMPTMQPHRVAYATGVITFCSSLLTAVGLALGIYVGEKLHFPTSFMGGSILLFIALKMVMEYFIQC